MREENTNVYEPPLEPEGFKHIKAQTFSWHIPLLWLSALFETTVFGQEINKQF